MRLFLSFTTPIPSSPLTRLIDQSIAVVQAPPDTDEEDRTLSRTSPVNAIVDKSTIIPLTAGTPLDTVRGLSWGAWAGCPDSPPVSFMLYACL